MQVCSCPLDSFQHILQIASSSLLEHFTTFLPGMPRLSKEYFNISWIAGKIYAEQAISLAV
jgi:hypothetical protein